MCLLLTPQPGNGRAFSSRCSPHPKKLELHYTILSGFIYSLVLVSLFPRPYGLGTRLSVGGHGTRTDIYVCNSNDVTSVTDQLIDTAQPVVLCPDPALSLGKGSGDY